MLCPSNLFFITSTLNKSSLETRENKGTQILSHQWALLSTTLSSKSSKKHHKIVHVTFVLSLSLLSEWMSSVLITVPATTPKNKTRPTFLLDLNFSPQSSGSLMSSVHTWWDKWPAMAATAAKYGHVWSAAWPARPNWKTELFSFRASIINHKGKRLSENSLNLLSSP